jgi:hypothetical protein
MRFECNRLFSTTDPKRVVDFRNGEWLPATVDEVNDIVASDLKACDFEQLAVFSKFSVKPFVAPIMRYGKMESVVVVARNGDQVIYYEDVEDGFNVSPLSPDGLVLEHWCNQDELRFPLNAWIEGRGLAGRLGPAVPVRE